MRARLAVATLSVALSGLTGCSALEAGYDDGSAQAELQALARQGADDYVDAVVAEGYPSWEKSIFEVRETMLRGTYDVQQYPCAQGKPTHYDVREVNLDGTRAAVIADRDGKLTSFWLQLDEGRFRWAPTASQFADLRSGKGACG